MLGLVATLLLTPLAPLPQNAELMLEPTQYAACVRAVGDCDLDGSTDIIVGSYQAKKGKGRAVVFSGKTGKQLFSIQGRNAGALFALTVGSAGDADNDGAADFMIGAPLDEVRGKRVGVVRVYSGRTGKILFELSGKDDGERYGFALNNAGDVNQDGFGDFIIGAPGARLNKSSSPGAARVYSGKDASLLFEWYGEKDGDEFGATVDRAGDCDADGKTDLFVGARAGYARVYAGRKGKTLHELDPDAKERNARYAWCVRTAGDVNQDGAADLIVGIPWGKEIAARVHSGKKKAKVLHEIERDTRSGTEGFSLGVAVDSAGDVNADGFDDFMVADPGFPVILRDVSGELLPELHQRIREKVARPGRVVIYDGHKAKELLTLKGTERDDLFGVSISPAGDVDQDGAGDVVIASALNGKVVARIYDGRNGKVLQELKVD